MRPFEKLVVAVFGRIARAGELDVGLPDGTRVTVGKGTPTADVTFRDGIAVRQVLRRGLLGFADAHMDGRIDTKELSGLLRWAVANHDAWYQHPVARVIAPMRRIWNRIRPERRHPRVRTMRDHYDLGNDFYASWLDPSMTYSSARFEHPDQSLGDAQLRKYRTIARHAGLAEGMRVLEIGCGWGGFAEYAAGELGCHVTAVTISHQQWNHARARISAAGLDDRVDVLLTDFTDVTGSFDAIVSIEMIESIDESRWPGLFQTMARRLQPGARVAMQAITIDDAIWDDYRDGADFIRQYIFPGGQLPAPKVLAELAASNGFEVEQVETFGLDYARTLVRWRERFEEVWPALEGRDGLDERFRRMWGLYLTVCEAGFRSGRCDVQQWVFTGVRS